jgi:lipopolysaccharide export system protein LptA
MLNNTRKKIGKVGLTLVAVLALGVVAIAQRPVEQKVSFYLDGKIGNEVVKKGTYTLVIPESDQGALEIKVGKKTITAQFTKRQNKEEAEADKMTYRDSGDGARIIATITPRGRKFTLLLEESGVASK